LWTTQGAEEQSSLKRDYLDDGKIVNVIIAKNFNQTQDDIQIQALELLNSKRVFSRTAVHTTPNDFLFIPVVASENNDCQCRYLNKHLNEHLLLSHFHDPQDGYLNVELDDEWISDDQGSVTSVIRKTEGQPSREHRRKHVISEDVIMGLRQASKSVTVRAEMARYLQNIVVFLRLSRAVAGGISAKATKHFLHLAMCLAPLHGIDYLTPSLIALAAKKVYRHRIVLAAPEEDRSLQYGSDPNAVSQLLKDVTSDTIIDNVIGEVEAPL